MTRKIPNKFLLKMPKQKIILKENRNFILGIFAGIIISILGNFIVTSFYKIVKPNLYVNLIILITSAVLIFFLIFYSKSLLNK